MKVFAPFENKKLNEVEDEEKEHSKHPDCYYKNFASITRRSRPDNVNNKSNSFVAHEFEESSDYINHKQKLLPRIWDYMKNSSLFIFHNTWEFRQWLIMTVVSSENLTTRKTKIKHFPSVADNSPENKNSEDESCRDDNSENENSCDDNLESMASTGNVFKIK
jgi:hypothetical protein